MEVENYLHVTSHLARTTLSFGSWRGLTGRSTERGGFRISEEYLLAAASEEREPFALDLSRLTDSKIMLIEDLLP